MSNDDYEAKHMALRDNLMRMYRSAKTDDERCDFSAMISAVGMACAISYHAIDLGLSKAATLELMFEMVRKDVDKIFDSIDDSRPASGVDGGN